MKIFILILVLTCPCLAQQQTLFTGSGNGNFLGKPRDFSNYVNTEGNPYLLEGWYEGLVFPEINSKAFKLPKMRYNVLEELIEYEQNGKVFSLEPKEFSQFVLLKGADSLLFRNRIGGDGNNLSRTAYFQLIFNKKNTWLRKDTKSLINDPSATYGTSKKKVILDDHSFYLLKGNSESIPLKLSKKFFIKRFGIPNDEFQKFLDNKTLSFDKDSNLGEIFKWLDSQIK